MSNRKEVLKFVCLTPVIDSNKSSVVQTNDDGDSSFNCCCWDPDLLHPMGMSSRWMIGLVQLLYILLLVHF